MFDVFADLIVTALQAISAYWSSKPMPIKDEEEENYPA